MKNKNRFTSKDLYEKDKVFQTPIGKVKFVHTTKFEMKAIELFIDDEYITYFCKSSLLAAYVNQRIARTIQ